MIRVEDVVPDVALIRCYPDNADADDPFADFCGVVTAHWESPSVLWLKGMCGTVTRTHLREICRFALSKGVRLLKAKRAPNRRLPRGFVVGDHLEVDLTLLENV